MESFLVNETSRRVADALKEKRDPSKEQAEQGALAQMCRVILNLNEFVYVE